MWILIFIVLDLFVYLAGQGLHCCVWAFSSCSEWRLLFIALHGLLMLCGLLCCGVRAVDTRASAGAVHGLSCGAQA